MSVRGFEKARKVVTTLVVAALVAALSYGVSSLVTRRSPRLELTTTSDPHFTISSTLDATYTGTGCSGGTATLAPGVERCLTFTITNPLSVSMTVKTITVTAVARTSNTHTYTSCTPELATFAITNFSGTRAVAPGPHTTVVAEPIMLDTTNSPQTACAGATVTFTYSGTAYYTTTSPPRTTTTTTSPVTTPPAPPTTSKDVSTGSSTSPTGSTGTVVSKNPTTHVTATVNATGIGAVTVSQLTSTTKPPPAALTVGALVDVEVSSTSSFTKLTEKVCGPKVGTSITWYDTKTGKWVTLTTTPAPALSKTTPPCVSFSLSATSSPTIAQLSGTAFAIGTALPPAPAPPVSRITGKTADATAAKELTNQFTPTHGECPGSGSVVLVRDNYYSDALAAQYLAASVTAGVLLTSTNSLSTVTKTTIEDEGISHVYIVGGTLAISTAVEKAIEALPVYECGGKTKATGTVEVTRIAGATEYATAAKVATTVGTSAIGHADLAGAYAGTNSSGGDGKFNDTAGVASTTAPTGSPATAILATGAGFQDAESASVMSYDEHFPILLTTPTSLSSEAATAIKSLGITQVIVMGGQVAISNGVVAQLQALGVSVLRVAGIDYTDTSAEAANFELGASGLHWSGVDQVVVARGDFYSDGIAGAIVAAGAGRSNTHDPEPLLLTENPTTVGTYLKDFLQAAGKTTGIATDGKKVSSLAILGGTLAITTKTVAAMQADLGGTSNRDRHNGRKAKKS